MAATAQNFQSFPALSDAVAYSAEYGGYYDPLTMFPLDEFTAELFVNEAHRLGQVVDGVDAGDAGYWGGDIPVIHVSDAVSAPENHNPLDPNATPDLDSWGPDGYWEPQDWVNWYAAMNATLGAAVAKERFLAAWNQQSWGAAPLVALITDTAFRNFLKNVGLWQSTTNQSQQVIGEGADFVKNAADGLKNAFSLGPFLQLLVPVGLLVWGLSYVARPINQAKSIFK